MLYGEHGSKAEDMMQVLAWASASYKKILPHGYKRQEICQMPQQTLDFLEKIMGVDTTTYPYDGIHDQLNLVESALISPLFPPI